MKRIAFVLLLTALAGLTTAGQTLTEQLQRGIYTEETLGDRVEAAKIYRQIVAAPAVPQAIAAEAQRRLARLSAAQGPGEPTVAIPLTDQMRPIRRQPQRGAVEQGRYRHFTSGITFDVGPGWTAAETFPSSDGGEMVSIDNEKLGWSILVWMIKEEVPPAQVATLIAEAPAQKVRQRHSGYGIPGMFDSSSYDIPAQTIRPILINGRQGVVAVGQYMGVTLEGLRHLTRALNVAGAQDFSPNGVPVPPGEPMNEYMTWIYTPHARAFFFSRVEAANLHQLQPHVEQLVYSANIP